MTRQHKCGAPPLETITSRLFAQRQYGGLLTCQGDEAGDGGFYVDQEMRASRMERQPPPPPLAGGQKPLRAIPSSQEVPSQLSSTC